MMPEVQFITDHSATEEHDIGDQRASQALPLARRMVANDHSMLAQKGTLNARCIHRDGADG